MPADKERAGIWQYPVSRRRPPDAAMRPHDPAMQEFDLAASKRRRNVDMVAPARVGWPHRSSVCIGRRSMFVRFGLAAKSPSLGIDEFRRRWSRAGAASLPGIAGVQRHHRHHVVDRQQRAIDYARGRLDIDGISQLWFEDAAALDRALAVPAHRLAVDGDGSAVGRQEFVHAIQHVVIPTPADTPAIKRMSLLRRRADVTPQVFQREWFDFHSILVKRMPCIKAYTQNLVVDRRDASGGLVDHAAIPIDGIVEVWFDDLAGIETAFKSGPGVTLMTHALEFIADITTFLVETEIVE